MSRRRGLGSVHELPAELPEGEHVMWQGAPGLWALARSLHIRVVAGYFAVLLGWYVFDTLWRGAPDPLRGIARMAGLSLAAVSLFAIYAVLARWNTSYTLTNRRLVIQTGIALPISFNIPFGRIDAASVRENGDATGDIVMSLAPGGKIGYVALWPNARPWQLAPVQPMLRAIPDVGRVARTLLHLVEASGQEVVAGSRRATAQAAGYGGVDEQMIAAE